MIRNVLHMVWSVVMHVWLLGVVAVILFGSLATNSSFTPSPSDVMASVPVVLIVSGFFFLMVWLVRSRRMNRMMYAVRMMR